MNFSEGGIIMETKLVKGKEFIGYYPIFGDLEGSRGKEFEESINGLLEKGVKYILIDIHKCDSITSTIIGILHAKQKIIGEKGGRFFLFLTDDSVKHHIEISNLGYLIANVVVSSLK